MSLIVDDKKKPKEEIKAVFITLSLRKIDFDTDKKNCFSMYETIQKRLDKKQDKIELYYIVMEFGKSGENPHLHIVLVLKENMNWTQINRIIKNPVMRSVNPLNWTKFSCKSKKAMNVEYLLDEYMNKEWVLVDGQLFRPGHIPKSIKLKEYGIDWLKVKKTNDEWKKNNLHKKPLHLRYISKNTLPQRIMDYATWKNLPLNTLVEYITVIEIMYRDKYNMSSLYMTSSLMKQTFNCIKVLQGANIDYNKDYYIHVNKRTDEPKIDMTSDRKVVSKSNCEKLKYIAGTF